MKNKLDLLLAIFLVVISFSFTSCESEKEEIKAKFTYLGEFVSCFDFPTPPQQSITCIVNDNSLLLKKKNSRFPGIQDFQELLMEISPLLVVLILKFPMTLFTFTKNGLTLGYVIVNSL